MNHLIYLNFGVPSNVVWTSSEVLKSDSDLTVSLSVDVEVEFFSPDLRWLRPVVHLELETPLKKKKKFWVHWSTGYRDSVGSFFFFLVMNILNLVSF
jgi:hypothetical protein